uniref:(northern house mosquito) hypothetical protein n=1 Tax=Culex pipiens TaxID=7175 RepID=A0A8D8D4X6_CULPI
MTAHCFQSAQHTLTKSDSLLGSKVSRSYFFHRGQLGKRRISSNFACDLTRTWTCSRARCRSATSLAQAAVTEQKSSVRRASRGNWRHSFRTVASPTRGIDVRAKVSRWGVISARWSSILLVKGVTG